MSGQPLRSICRLSLFVGAAAAQFIRPATVSAQQLYQLERDDVRIIYTSSLQRYLLPHVVRRFETALAKHSSLIGFKPTERTTLLLSDYRDEGNASATGVPRNYMNFQLSPFRYTYETIPSSERVGFLMSHELVHVAEGDMAAGSDLTFRRLLGGKPYPSAEHPISLLYAYLASPRRFSPKWYNEGLAVFMETWMMGGLGRGLGAYDEMVFRTRILEGRKLYDYVGLESEGTTVDFQVGANAYLYGTRFLSYLASEYGPEQVASWIGRREGTKGYFSREFARIFGKSLSEGWSEWTAFEQSFQEANLAAIRSNPVTEHRDLTSGAVGSVSRAFWDASRGEVYAAVNAPGQVARIVALRIADSRVRSLTEVKGGAIFYVSSVAYDPNSGLLFYTTDNSRLRDIRSVNVDTGESRMLLKNARIGDLAYNPADRSLWGVRHFNGVSTIVRVPYPYEEWDQVTSLRYGLDFYDLDVSPSGEVVTGSLVDINGEQRLVSFVVDSLLAGGSYAKTLFRFGRSNPESFVFTDDGRYLYGSSYYSGVSNVFRYDMQADDMEVLTNAETGYFRPTRISEDSVFAFRYSSNGFVPVALPNRAADRVGAIKFLGQTIVDKFPVVKEWELPASQPLDTDSLRASITKYRPVSELGLRALYPIVQGYKDFVAVGLRGEVTDAVGIHRLSVDASYSPNTDSLDLDERFHLDLRYDLLRWSFRATYNRADFYDLAGPTKTSRKGYSVSAGYAAYIIYDRPRTLHYALEVAGYFGLDRLPNAQNINASFENLLAAEGSLVFRNVRSSLGRVDDEKGVMWSITPSVNYANREAWPLLHTELDLGIPLPMGHSSIWLRGSTGISTDQPDEPFSNFFFGGFGNNYVDRMSEQRYREYYAFPGVDLNQIFGTNYVKGMVEWTIPPLRFERIGSSGFYLQWARLAAFSTAITTNMVGSGEAASYANVGAQLDLRLKLLTYFPITVSTGYAHAWDIQSSINSDEFMVSVKILGH